MLTESFADNTLLNATVSNMNPISFRCIIVISSANLEKLQFHFSDKLFRLAPASELEPGRPKDQRTLRPLRLTMPPCGLKDAERHDRKGEGLEQAARRVTPHRTVVQGVGSVASAVAFPQPGDRWIADIGFGPRERHVDQEVPVLHDGLVWLAEPPGTANHVRPLLRF